MGENEQKDFNYLPPCGVNESKETIRKLRRLREAQRKRMEGKR